MSHMVNITGFDDIFNDFAKEVYKAKGEGKKIDRKLYAKTAEKLTDGLMENFSDKVEFGHDDPENLLAAKMRSNLHAFSAAKSLSMYNDFSGALLDENGDIKPFNKFRQEVSKINALYNEEWLKTEYETAIASGQAAATWQRLEQNRDIAPILEYHTQEDSRVSPEHQQLHLLTAHIDSHIWNTIYPPNRWRCRCYVMQKGKGTKETPAQEVINRVKNADVQPLFKTNVGKTGVVVKGDHPYYANVKGKVTELDAVKNYGMPDWRATNNYRKDHAPAMPAAKPKQELYEWWKEKVQEHGVGGEDFAIADVNGSKILFDAHQKMKGLEQFREHAIKKHSDIAHLSEEVVSKADEAWSFYDVNEPGKPLLHTYLKYYKDKIIALVVREEKGVLRAVTIYPVDNLSTFNNMRKGVLLHANKKF